MPVGCGISLARRGTSFTTSVGCSNPGGVHTVQENALKQELEEALTQGKGSVKGSVLDIVYYPPSFLRKRVSS